MDKKRASENLLESFVRLVNKYNALGKHPMTYGTLHQFYHSERHMLDIVGNDPGLNITEFAKAAGVTKGAISQVVSKLEKKADEHRHNHERIEYDHGLIADVDGLHFFQLSPFTA